MTDLASLLAAVIANPDEDTVRVAYADALDETGCARDAALAEYIRVECELEALKGSPHADGPRVEHCVCTKRSGCRRCELQARSRKLLDANPHWIELPCPACVTLAHGVHNDDHANAPCPACGGSGDLRLTRKDDRRGGPHGWDYIFQDVRLRRGLPHVVNMQSDVVFKAIRGYPRISVVPTVRAQAVLAVSPTLREVGLLDVVPSMLGSDAMRASETRNNWVLTRGDTRLGVAIPGSVVPVVYDLLEGGESWPLRGWSRLFRTEWAAKESLARAVCKWIRSHPPSH